jgi:hypothetical protein
MAGCVKCRHLIVCGPGGPWRLLVLRDATPDLRLVPGRDLERCAEGGQHEPAEPETEPRLF